MQRLLVTSPDTERKQWGSACDLARGDAYSVSLARIRPWHRCSRHHHVHKSNTFYVVSGVLYVKVEHPSVTETEPARVVRYTLGEGDSLTVPAGLVHRFETEEEAAVVIETYAAIGPVSADIVRQDEGGSWRATPQSGMVRPDRQDVG
jgi:mannose-6-phosphate isomerase-like protein (cupin superfamily)